MSWKLVWARPALKDMKKLGHINAERVRKGLVRLAEIGHGDVKKLKNVEPPEWRLRVGDYRAFFRYESEASEIQVLRVRHRSDAYDR